MDFQLTPRATKKAYFSDLDGGNILEFQFMPHELDITEGGDFVERIPVGNYFPELMWVKGKSVPFQLQFFVDRTLSSYVSGDFNQDPFSDLKRFPNKYSKYTQLDIVNLVRNISGGRDASGFIGLFGNNRKGDKREIASSGYSASPHYNQPLDDDNGVLKDLESLLYFVRPAGIKLSEITIQTRETFSKDNDGIGTNKIKFKDFQQERFTPPPMVRFYYGSIWREGYLSEVQYNLSAINKKLIPQRMDARITMLCTRWGYLSEVGSKVEAISADNPNNDSNVTGL